MFAPPVATRWTVAIDPDQRFAALVDELVGIPWVLVPGGSGRRGFGSTTVTVNGSIFAMLSHGRLVVKLQRARVAALIETGAGGPFDAGKGTPMKEWLAVSADDNGTWLTLAREAYEFVASRR